MNLTRKRILLIDNHDSFVYNLFHLVDSACCGSADINVVLNDKIDFTKVRQYDSIIISPGPGVPLEAGDIISLIKEFAPNKSILGICLGHQAIAEAFGGRIYAMEAPLHGVQSNVNILDDKRIFKGLGQVIKCGRYHSWAVDKETLPAQLRITAVDKQGCIMALSHCSYDVHGLQFHPESFLTGYGECMIKNFFKC